MFYDARNFLTNIQHENTLTPAILADYTYGYDLAGNRTSMTDVSGGVTTNITWDYDAANRLIEEHNDRNDIGFTTEYQYDQNGNRTREIRANGDIIRYSYNENDQLTEIAYPDYITEEYSYDARGNLATVHQQEGISSPVEIAAYSYDARNQLTSVTSGIDTLGTFSYDYAGRRTQMNDGTLTTDYLWDEFSAYGDVVLETNVAGTTAYTLASGTLISQTVDTGTPVTSYFLTDAIGSTRMLTDVSGQPAGSFEYDAFGNLLGEPDVQSLGTDYLYAGQQFDPMTELYSMRARYYDSAVGRFMSRDTYKYNYRNPVELNRYVYTANNPVKIIDPSGETGIIGQALKTLTVDAKNRASLALYGAGTGALWGAVIGGVHAAATVMMIDAGWCYGRGFDEKIEHARRNYILGSIAGGAAAGAVIGAGIGYGGLARIAAGAVLTTFGIAGLAGSFFEGGSTLLFDHSINACAVADGVLSVLAIAGGIHAINSGRVQFNAQLNQVGGSSGSGSVLPPPPPAGRPLATQVMMDNRAGGASGRGPGTITDLDAVYIDRIIEHKAADQFNNPNNRQPFTDWLQRNVFKKAGDLVDAVLYGNIEANTTYNGSVTVAEIRPIRNIEFWFNGTTATNYPAVPNFEASLQTAITTLNSRYQSQGFNFSVRFGMNPPPNP